MIGGALRRCASVWNVCIQVSQKVRQWLQGNSKESAVIASNLLLLMVDHSHFQQEIGPLPLECINFVLVLVPEGVAGRTGLVLPPGLVAPPPPFPIPWVRAEPLPLLDMCCVYFSMTFPEMGVYLLLKPAYLLAYDCLQADSDCRQVLLAGLEVFLDIGDGHCHVATGTTCGILCGFEDKGLNRSHILKFLPAERALALVLMDDPSLDAGKAENVLAVDEAGVGHELETDGASKFLVGLLADKQLQVHAGETHIKIFDYQKYGVRTQFQFSFQSSPFLSYSLGTRDYPSLFTIAFKQLFQMNYQQHRNPLLTHSHSQPYATPYHILHPPNNPPHLPFLNLERQPSSKGNLLKLPFNPNGYSEMKEYFRPQQTTITAPLTFNMQSPSKLKAKKTNRPASKIANKSYNSPFTQELQRQFFKNQPTLHHTQLEDFSKTTSSVNGSSFLNFNLQQTFTQPNDDRIYTPMKLQSEPPQSNKITHSNSVKILFQREAQNKPYSPNLFNHTSSTYFPKPAYEPSSANKPRENPPSYLHDQKFLLDEIKGFKEMNEKYQQEIMRLNVEIKAMRSSEAERKDELRGSRKENKFQSRQLELKSEQNNKLLAQIEDMEKDLKGKVQLNRYLEHQCNSYSEKYEQINKQFDSFKATQGEERIRNEQALSSLRKHLADMQNQANISRINLNNRQGQILQLKKALQLQGQKLQQLSTNNQIDKSQINVLTKRLENFQAKYQKLMLSHCETEGKLRNHEGTHQEALILVKKKQQQFVRDIQGIESKLKAAAEDKQALRLQLTSLRKEMLHLENRTIEMKDVYEQHYDIVRQELAETNKIVESKTEENQHIRLKIEAKAKENEEIQHKLRQVMPTVEELKKRTSQKATLQGLLKEKSSEVQLLQARQKSLQDDYIKISCQIEQRNTVIAGQASQIEEIKAKLVTFTSENAQIMSRYDSLRVLFESQSFRVKELQSNLSKQQIQYNILQNELGEYSSQFSILQKEYDELKQHYEALQPQQIQNIHNFTLQSEILHSKNKESTTKIQEKSAQISRLEKSKLQVQTQLHQAKENLMRLDELKLLCLQYEYKIKDQSEQAQQSLHRFIQLQQKCALIQSEYLQALQQAQSVSQSRQAQLSSSCKSEVQTWQLLSKKEVQIQTLLNKIQILDEKVQSKTDQLHAIAQKEAKEEIIRLEIQELMMIVEENQKRSQEEKGELVKIIEGMKGEINSLQQKMTEEGLEYNSIIIELKASIEALHAEQSSLSLLTTNNKMKTSINQGQQLQLKQWNSLSEFQSFDSIEDNHSRKIESAQELPEQMRDVAYIEMDREGVNYLCQLLQIDPAGGNILSQIVVRVENSLNQVQLSRKICQSYREVLQAFSVQEGVGSGGKLMGEITNFKESLGLLIEQLNEQQICTQALRGECCQLRLMHEGELIKGQRMIQELQAQGDLTLELNEIILALNAKLTNQRLRMAEAMTLAKLSLSEQPISSEKFVTARSIGDGPASQSSPFGESDIE